jgi:hypothetical protein
VPFTGLQRRAGIKSEPEIPDDEGVGECPRVFGGVLHNPDVVLQDG